VRDIEDVRHFASHGANAVLVGEALVSDSTPRERIAEFMTVGAKAIAARA
jgi:indole-3-glycerol phosphate synthase